MNKPVALSSPQERPTQEEPLATRRHFLGGLVTGGMGLVGLSVVTDPIPQPPRELSLQEADFYAPHTLAG